MFSLFRVNTVYLPAKLQHNTRKCQNFQNSEKKSNYSPISTCVSAWKYSHHQWKIRKILLLNFFLLGFLDDLD